MERTKARRQSALLWSEISGTSILLGNISGNVGGKNPEMEIVLAKIEEILKRGSLEKLRDQILERRAFDTRITEISKTLKDAGAE